MSLQRCVRKMQRGVRAIQFTSQLKKSAEQKESLDDVMVEVAEAVAQHWLDVRLHYIAVVMGYLTGAPEFGVCCGRVRPGLSNVGAWCC